MSDHEQRKQFEADWLEASPMSLPSDFARDSVGGYENDYLEQRWRGWLAAHRSRDAEVQALREALESVHYRATRWEVLPTVEAHQSVLQDIGKDARAALAGGETSETE